MKSYLLGLDVGTGGTRAVLIDKDGKVVSSATQLHQGFASPQNGWAEQDPEDWWEAAANAVRDCVTKAGIDGQQVACVGLAGQMHGAVLLDENDQVLRPAIIWCDQRTQKECDWLNEAVGRERLCVLKNLGSRNAFVPGGLLVIRFFRFF